MHPLHLRLADGSPGVIGAARVVAVEIAGDPVAFAVVVDGLASDNPGIRNRSAWALDRATRRHPDRLASHVNSLLDVAGADYIGGTLRRLLPLLLSRIPLDARQARHVLTWGMKRLDRVPVAEVANLFEALASIATQHPDLAPPTIRRLHAALDHPAPSVRARARHLAARLDRLGLAP